MGSAELAIHVVCVCRLLHAFQGALWHNKPGACQNQPTKESPHSGSWTSLHWRTNFVSQLTFGEKVGPQVDLWRAVVECVVALGGAQRSHPLTSLPSLYPTFPPTSPGEAETGPTIWELEVKLWAPVAPPRLGPGTPVTAFSPSNYPCQPQTLVLSPI